MIAYCVCVCVPAAARQGACCILQDKQNSVTQHRVQEHIHAGRTLDAIAAVEEAAPGTLDSHPRIKFQLQCQQFVEMVSHVAF